MSLVSPIEPVNASVDRPFFSVVLPTFNRVGYLEEALASVLSQSGLGDAEILVMDNHSELSDPKAIVDQAGDPRVKYVRQPENIAGRNWIDGIRRTTGQWVHLMHDDDRLRPGFYEAYREFIARHAEAGMVFCRAMRIDEAGREISPVLDPEGQSGSGFVEDALYKLAACNYVVCPTAVVRRDVYEKLGTFNCDLLYAGDHEMWMRIAAAYPLGFIAESLLEYRTHSESSSLNEPMAYDVVEAIETSVELGIALLPAERQEAARKSLHWCLYQRAKLCRNAAHHQNQHGKAVRYAGHAWRLHPTAKTLGRLAASRLVRLARPKRAGDDF